MPFVHLHVHTMFSLQDATAKPKEIIEKLKLIGQDSVAITDHGYIYGNVDFYMLCKKNKIKMLYGVEAYICNDMTEKDKDNRYNHIILLAQNDIGRININKLVSIADSDGFFYKPRIDYNLLCQHKSGIIVLSACMAGEFQRALIKEDEKTAIQIAKKYKNDFGNNYYLEIQAHKDPIQQTINKQTVKIAKNLKIPFVVTADSHYVNKDEQEFHSLFIQINQDRDVEETYTDCYIQSEEEIRENISYLNQKDIDEAVNNTQIICDKCNAEVPLSAPIIPHTDIPTEYKSEYDYLVQLCRNGWRKRQINKKCADEQKIYTDRLLYELDSVKKMGFEGYYLLVIDYIKEAKRKSPGRGSSGGSFIAYLIGITEIDPIKYGLYFERFIDVGALDLLEQGLIQPHELKIPDVDTDFGEEDREGILTYLTGKYGRNKVVSIGTFTYLHAKSAIKDMGRILDIPYDVTNEITSQLEGESIEEALINGVFEKYIDKYPLLFKNANKMAGLPKTFSTHASGKIIAQEEIYKYHAVYKADDGTNVIQCDMKCAESLGLVKIDLLGLRTIDVIYNVLEMIGKDYDYLKVENLDFTDRNVLDIFKKGLTTGIFQFESPGMKETLRKIGIDSIEEIAIANALYRPGSKIFIKNFIARKKGDETFEYLHKDLESILQNSFGIIVFQEQLIDIGRLAKIKNPDDIRIATGKKKKEVMDKVKPELEINLKNRGWTQDKFDKLWEQMLQFAAYSFNRSHAFLYAVVAFQTAFLKYYHPKEYVCATLNSYKGKIEEIKSKLNLLTENKINIEKFNFRDCRPICKIEGNKFYYGVSLIKSCNINMALELDSIKNMQFETFVDLLLYITENMSINKAQMEILISLNFFDEFGGNKKLLQVYEEFRNGKNKYTKKLAEKSKNTRSEVLKEFEANIDNAKLTFKEQMDIELEYVGTMCNKYNIDKRYVYVVNVNTKFSPRIELYCLSNGKSQSFKVQKKLFDNKPLKIGDFIHIDFCKEKQKSQKINDEWVKLDETEWWVESYSKIDNINNILGT